MSRTLVFVTALLAITAPAFAAPVDAPSQIVGKLYAPYLANPHAEESDDDRSAMDLIRPYASQAFGAAIDKDEACMIREQGICNLDFDVIINGQDWDISEFGLTDTWPNDTPPTVMAQFVNTGNLVKVTYHFIREDGVWKIDDIDSMFPVSSTVSVKALLNK